MIEGLCTLQSHPTRDPPYLIALTFYSLFHIRQFRSPCYSFISAPVSLRLFQPRLPYWAGVRLFSPLWCLVPVLYSVNDRCNRTLPLGKSRLSPAQQGGHFTRSPSQWTGLQCCWQFSTLPPIPHRTFAWYDGHMSMLSCAACGNPGTSHEWNVRQERGACKVRHNGRPLHVQPLRTENGRTETRQPINRTRLRRPKGR